MQGYRLYIISPGKSLKQQQQQKQKMWMKSRVATLCYLKCTVFKNNYETCKETVK